MRQEWPTRPYPGLSYYRAEDRFLYAGREFDVDQCVDLMSQPKTRIMMLHGRTAAGKSSFLRAGFVPALEERGHAFLFFRRKGADGSLKVSPIRCGHDPVSRIAESLYEFVTTPQKVKTARGEVLLELGSVLGKAQSLEEFVAECREEMGLSSAFGRLSASIKHTMVLIVDQVEEIVTLAAADDKQQRLFGHFLQEMLVQERSMIKLLLVMRKEAFADIFNLVQLDESIRTDVKQYGLRDLDQRDVLEALLLPTSREPVNGALTAPWDTYQFEFEPGLPELITTQLFESAPSGGVLPIMQIVCNDLYNSVAGSEPPRIIDKQRYLDGGSITGRVDRHISRSVRRGLEKVNHKSQKEEMNWREALSRFVVQFSDGTARTDVFTEQRLRSELTEAGISYDPRPVLEYLSQPETLLLRTFKSLSGELKEETFYSLGHDVIALTLAEWKVRVAEEQRVMAEADERARRVKRTRDRWQVAVGALGLALILGALGYAAYAVSEYEKVQDQIAEYRSIAAEGRDGGTAVSLPAAVEIAALSERRHPLYFWNQNTQAVDALRREFLSLPRRGFFDVEPSLRQTNYFVLADQNEILRIDGLNVLISELAQGTLRAMPASAMLGGTAPVEVEEVFAQGDEIRLISRLAHPDVMQARDDHIRRLFSIKGRTVEELPPIELKQLFPEMTQEALYEGTFFSRGQLYAFRYGDRAISVKEIRLVDGAWSASAASTVDYTGKDLFVFDGGMFELTQRGPEFRSIGQFGFGDVGRFAVDPKASADLTTKVAEALAAACGGLGTTANCSVRSWSPEQSKYLTFLVYNGRFRSAQAQGLGDVAGLRLPITEAKSLVLADMENGTVSSVLVSDLSNASLRPVPVGSQVQIAVSGEEGRLVITFLHSGGVDMFRQTDSGWSFSSPKVSDIHWTWWFPYLTASKDAYVVTTDGNFVVNTLNDQYWDLRGQESPYYADLQKLSLSELIDRACTYYLPAGPTITGRRMKLLNAFQTRCNLPQAATK